MQGLQRVRHHGWPGVAVGAVGDRAGALAQRVEVVDRYHEDATPRGDRRLSVYLPLEFQSGIDPLMVVRVATDVSLFYQNLIEQGHQHGCDEGRRETAIGLLTRLLRPRIAARPDWAGARVAAASAAELELLTDAVLTADTL